MFVLLSLPAAGQTDRQIEAVQLEHFQHWGYSSVSWNPRWEPVPAGEASRLEGQLRSNPEDVAARVRLLNYYWHNGMRPQRAELVLWLIAHHADSPILGLDLAWLFATAKAAGDHYGAMHDDGDFLRARQLWEVVVAQPLEIPEVLHNAARFFEATDPARSAALAGRLQEIDPAGHGKVVAYYFERVAPAHRR
jgi:hypothetical protein